MEASEILRMCTIDPGPITVPRSGIDSHVNVSDETLTKHLQNRLNDLLEVEVTGTNLKWCHTLPFLE